MRLSREFCFQRPVDSRQLGTALAGASLLIDSGERFGRLAVSAEARKVQLVQQCGIERDQSRPIKLYQMFAKLVIGIFND